MVAHIGSIENPSVLIEAHMDTVGVDGWAVGDPYKLECREGKWYGRGSCDTKASLATFLLLAARCKEREGELNRSLVFAATADEEAAQLGAYKLAELKLVLIFRSPNWRASMAIVTKHKGACRYDSSQGQGCSWFHSSIGKTRFIKLLD